MNFLFLSLAWSSGGYKYTTHPLRDVLSFHRCAISLNFGYFVLELCNCFFGEFQFVLKVSYFCLNLRPPILKHEFCVMVVLSGRALLGGFKYFNRGRAVFSLLPITYLNFSKRPIAPFFNICFMFVGRKCQFSSCCKQGVHILCRILKYDFIITFWYNGFSTLYNSSCGGGVIARRIDRSSPCYTTTSSRTYNRSELK